jgi:hypothetical protein
LSQLVPAATGVCVTPPVGLQASAVHGLPSSRFGAEPATQVPVALHASAPLQALPSEQLVPGDTGRCCTPPTASHESAVHGLLSSTATGLPGEHVPALQISPTVQAFASEHGVAFGFAGFEQAPVLGEQPPAR